MLSRLCAQPPLHRRSACSAALPSSRDALGPALPLACRARRVARPTTARPCRASGSSNTQETSSAAATGSTQAAAAGEALKEQKEQQQQQPESAAAPPSVEHEGPSFSDLGVDRLFLVRSRLGGVVATYKYKFRAACREGTGFMLVELNRGGR